MLYICCFNRLLQVSDMFRFRHFLGDVENTRYLKQKLNFHYTH